MISARYAPALCGLIAMALVPTVIHGYVGARNEDGLRVESVPTELAGFRSTPSNRDDDWGRRKFESDNWLQRNYASGPDEVVLTILRSYDLKRLYHHPEIDIADGTGFIRSEVRRFPQRPEVPVHVLYTDAEPQSIAMYVLHAGEGYVADPIRFQLRTAAELLFSPRKRMTLLFAHDLAVPAGEDVEELPSLSLLFGAVDAFAGGRAN